MFLRLWTALLCLQNFCTLPLFRDNWTFLLRFQILSCTSEEKDIHGAQYSHVTWVRPIVPYSAHVTNRTWRFTILWHRMILLLSKFPNVFGSVPGLHPEQHESGLQPQFLFTKDMLSIVTGWMDCGYAWFRSLDHFQRVPWNKRLPMLHFSKFLLYNSWSPTFLLLSLCSSNGAVNLSDGSLFCFVVMVSNRSEYRLNCFLSLQMLG
jgi:hypothetical protein